MSGSFAITAATNTVLLDNNRQGQTSYTVTNTTNHTLRSRAHLVVQPAAAGSWLTLLGETEREFASSGSQQYVVQINVPPNAAAGDYTIRLDIVNVANPDDDFSEGPTIKFVVPAPVPTKKPFPWWIVAVAAGIVILIGAGTYGIVQLSHKPSTVTANKPTPTPMLPTPTPTLIVLSPGEAYQGTFTNDDGTTFMTQLTLTQAPKGGLQGFFTGTGYSTPVFGNTGSLNQFNSAARNRLQFAIKDFRNTGTFVDFFSSPYPVPNISIGCIYNGCLYDAVVYPDGSLHGVFFFTTNTPQPDGTFVFTKLTQGSISTNHTLSLMKTPVLAWPRDAYIRDIAVN